MNKLIDEKSPYLLQHADNPVNWYPWGDDAFSKAKNENKPIFLSIGYSTCHWCHVMAHESFEDPEAAKLMNDVFVSIKVDREERPDIDSVYMMVCQMMTGTGGWPLTIFMTPDKKPFFAGTYFPKNSRFGRIGLIDLMNRVKELWISQKEELLTSAEQISQSLQNITPEAPGDKFNERVLKQAFELLIIRFDEKNGGFGERPKFPTPHNLFFLLRFWKRTGEKKALEIVEKTLKAMRRGGIYDHVGYGIHRYSTDSTWLVPHFEKMLYDQALVSLAYIETYQATKDDEYREVAQELFTYVLRDMTYSEGGFFSAEDADSEGEEGKFYIWSKEEIETILDQDLAELAIYIFNIQEGGNYLEEATRIHTGHNILHLKNSYDKIAERLNIPKQELKLKLEKIREKLFNVRKERIHPHKDDKILTDWNGLMLAALAKGGRVFQEPLYINAAKKALEFINSTLSQENGKLLHRFREGKADINAFLTDYTFLIWGLIELYEATFNITYIKQALDLLKIQNDDFWDDYIGGYFFTSRDNEELLMRQKNIYDGAIPSGNSVALLNLLRLSQITGDYALEEKADILSRVFSEKVENNPDAYTQLMVAADFAIGPSYSLVVAGKTQNPDTIKMIEVINDHYIPNKVFIQRKTEQHPPDIDKYSNFVQYFEDEGGKATAYICINKTCKPATQDLDKIIEYLKSEW
ncbi:MAG: thioredoxin domain-containing protein [Promethearchaeota archaeon]